MSKKVPFFSIIIVNFNHGQYLEQAIQSILSQTDQDYELIIVDGGSNDNSVKIIKHYADKLSWWVSEKDKGQSDAFNKGFNKATGQFFFWINADDLLLPNSLAKAKKIIKNNPQTYWFVANTIFFSKDGLIEKCRRGPSWMDFLVKNAPINVYGPTSIFHRNLFKKELGFDESLFYTMDSDLWLRFKLSGFRFKRIHEYFWGFRIHSESKTSHAFSKSPNADFDAERAVIQKKYKVTYLKFNILLQQGYKFVSGVYIRSFFDTLKMKGKNISSL